jgi:hypothetical protein
MKRWICGLAMVVVTGTLGFGGMLYMDNQEGTATPFDAIKVRLYAQDRDVSGSALAELIRLGHRATPVLLEALKHSDARIRRLAAEGLGEIGDATTANALFQATDDPHPEVRARAATALYQLKDKRAVATLVATLDDYPDILHNPYTASMYPLMQSDKQVLPLVVPLLKSPSALTRTRAFMIIKAVVMRLPEGKNWDNLWRSLGSYDPNGSTAERDRSIQQWQTWLAGLG